MKFAVTTVSPPGYGAEAVFHEVALSLHHGLLALGHDSVMTTEGRLDGRRQLVLGCNLLPRHPLPLAPDAILYNLEQADQASTWLTPPALEILRRHTVWDYSEHNARALAALGVPVAHVLPLGYVPELTRIEHRPDKQFDVLFFGSINPRRSRVFDQMRELGLEVGAAFGVWGAERDQYIGRARLMLNLHYYEAKILEMVRIAYLLANRCAVLSEPGADPDEDRALAGAVAFAPYEQLARRARELVDDQAGREALARRGFEVFSQRRMSEYLDQAIKTL
jgi:hypothetical protein